MKTFIAVIALYTTFLVACILFSTGIGSGVGTYTPPQQAKPAQHEPIVWTPEELRRLKQSYDEGTRELERAERERIERIEQYERRQMLNEMRDLNARQSRPVHCTHLDIGGGMSTTNCY